MFDSLGDRMKKYEKTETGRKFMPLLPVVARIDGKAFHTWTKGLDRPFDADMIQIMQNTTKKLVEETSAKVGYTQSDEISLVFYSDDIESQIFFDGKIFKMTSVLASMTTAIFNEKILSLAGNLYNDSTCYETETTRRLNKIVTKPMALFDCRVWQMPTKEEVCNYLVWREQDAVRNSIQSVGQANFSQKQLHGKSQKEIQEMLFQEKDINWNDCLIAEKRGTYFQKRQVERMFSVNELTKLPEKHEAKKNPYLKVLRNDIVTLNMPRLASIDNRIEVVFDGAEPVIKR